jgi:hypothetical protein
VSVPHRRILPEFAPYGNLFLHRSPFQSGEIIESEVETPKKEYFLRFDILSFPAT